MSVRDPDPAFAAVGLLRSEAKPTGKAVRPDLRAGINLAFRLRELLGVGARAEVVRFLLTVAAPAVSAQAVARSAGFAKRNVHDALVALHAAGVVSLWTVGNEQRYQIDRSAWTQLLAIDGAGLPQERAWPQLLAGLRKVRRSLHGPGLDELSDYLREPGARPAGGGASRLRARGDPGREPSRRGRVEGPRSARRPCPARPLSRPLPRRPLMSITRLHLREMIDQIAECEPPRLAQPGAYRSTKIVFVASPSACARIAAGAASISPRWVVTRSAGSRPAVISSSTPGISVRACVRPTW